MRLSHQIERYLVTEPNTTVRELSRYFGISETRCREELAGLVPYGVELNDEGVVLVSSESTPCVAGFSDHSTRLHTWLD